MGDYTYIHMFNDITECNNIVINKGDSDYLALLLTTEDDKNLNDLEYIEFFGARYESDNMHFVIYAYDFTDSKTAKGYFKSCAKRESIGNRDCYVYTDSRKYIVTALDLTRAYSLYSEPKCRKAVDNYLRRAFSIEMKSLR